MATFIEGDGVKKKRVSPHSDEPHKVTFMDRLKADFQNRGGVTQDFKDEIGSAELRRLLDKTHGPIGK